jgi:hypothetical protein
MSLVTGKSCPIQPKGNEKNDQFVFSNFSYFFVSGWTRLIYSTAAKMPKWVPEFVLGFLNKQALVEVFSCSSCSQRELILLFFFFVVGNSLGQTRSREKRCSSYSFRDSRSEMDSSGCFSVFCE